MEEIFWQRVWSSDLGYVLEIIQKLDKPLTVHKSNENLTIEIKYEEIEYLEDDDDDDDDDSILH